MKVFCSVFVGGFNLDIQSPFLFHGPPSTSNHSSLSQFGFAVQLWKDRKGNKGVAVGAPGARSEVNFGNANVSIPVMMPTGLLYYCPIHSPQLQCDPMNQAMPTFKVKSQMDAFLLAKQDANFGSFLSLGFGETIAVSKAQKSASLLVCAPRFVGLSKDGTSLTTRGACTITRSTDSKDSTDIQPLEDDRVILEGKTLRQRSGNFGMSALLFKRDKYVIAAPFTSKIRARGALFSKSGSKQGFRGAQANYVGWAMTRGDFDGSSIETFAVTQHTQSENTSPLQKALISFYGKKFNFIPHRAEIDLIERQIGSQFGAALTSGDFDGDKIDDLCASAYLSSKSNMRDLGAVFIFYAPTYKGNDRTRIPASAQLMIEGKVQGGYFGYALSSPGDLNMDGFDDLVVGAPYEGNGKVYIYSGSSGGLRNKPTQIIESPSGMQISPGSSSLEFGFSLSFGLDLDDNHYPDIAIGARNGNAVVVYKSLPVIRLVINAKLPNTVKLGDNKRDINIDHENRTSFLSSFPLRLNLSYESEFFREDVDVDVQIELDIFQFDPRILFERNNKRM